MASPHAQQLTLVPPEPFARTYAGRAYDDPWQAVEDYRTVMEWSRDHPSDGVAKIARRFDLPKGRVQAWLNDSQPQPVRGLDTALYHGWVDMDPASGTFRGLNALVAWIIQSGSIAADTWTPTFIVRSERDRDLLSIAGSFVGVELDLTRSPTAGRCDEMRPVQHGSVLGRVLQTLGAPRGDSRKSGKLTLPDYLSSVPDRLGREFVQFYLHHLGERNDDRYYLYLREHRTADYAEEVADLIRRLTTENVSVIEKNVLLSTPASREVGVWDPLLGVD